MSDEEIAEAERHEIRKAADELLESIRDVVDGYVLLDDLDALSEFSGLVDMHMAYRLLKDLREKGFGKEIRKLCDKAGRVKR